MNLNEDHESLFFDACMNIWEKVKKQPAVRYYFALFILEIARKNAEIKNELEHLNSDYYTQTLSPGIKRIFERELAKIN